MNICFKVRLSMLPPSTHTHTMRGVDVGTVSGNSGPVSLAQMLSTLGFVLRNHNEDIKNTVTN
jgi:hypothetical protein